MKARLIALIALVAVAIAPFAAIRAQGNTIVDVAVANGSFKTLVAAVEAAGLVDTLKSEGPFTVFAPTDEAFAKVPAEVIAYLLKPENKELLTRVLTYHVVAGKVMSKDVAGLTEAASVEGGMISVAVSGESVKVNSANVVAVDVEASNGVIHVIDSVILPEIKLPEVDPLAVQGNILTAGSSTVFPLTRRMADLFRNEGFADNIEVASVGTGAGFERFCKAGETDISNASAPIKSSQIDDCRAIGREPIEFYVAVDALAVVVNKENTWATNVTLEQLNKIFSGAAKTWADVDPSYPAEEIKLFSPGSDSGTFEFFVETIFEKDKQPLLEAPGIQLSEDDNVLVQGVTGSKGAIGYFGYAYFEPNQDKLNLLQIEGVEATPATAENGSYKLARPLFIYTTAAILQEKPQVAAFVNFYLTNVISQLGIEADKINYFATNSDVQNLDRLIFLAATAK